MDWTFLLFSAIKIVAVFAILMFLVAYVVLLERRLSAAMQDRLGPNAPADPSRPSSGSSEVHQRKARETMDRLGNLRHRASNHPLAPR
jgi:hypothetical protein